MNRALSCWLTLLAVLLALLSASEVQAADRSFARRFPATGQPALNTTGNISIIGNTLETCLVATTPVSPASCAASVLSVAATTSGSLATSNNNNYNMVYVNQGGAAGNGTLNASQSVLGIPAVATVKWAGLYWAGDTAVATRNTVKFATPRAGYRTVTASVLDTASTANKYQGFADVTADVLSGGNGSYTVADVQSTIGSVDRYAGWSLVVVYADASEKPRNLAVFDGLVSVSAAAVNITVSPFTTPPAGAVNARIGVVAYDGDRGTVGDALKMNSSDGATSTPLSAALFDTARPAGNFFDSSISQAGSDTAISRTPSYANQLGFDIAMLDVLSSGLNAGNAIIKNNATSATLNLTTTGDVYYPGVVTTAIEIYAPTVTSNLTKTVSDVNGGGLEPGDVLEYTISASNTGQDGASNVVLSDVMPVGTTYVPGSLVVASGANAGSKTDAAGNDQAEYAAGNRTVTFWLGTGAASGVGGTLAPTASTSVKFRVTVDAATTRGTVINNAGTVNFTAQTLGTAFTGNTPTASIAVSRPDLTLSKTHTGSFTVGSPASFTFAVNNIGPGTATSATLTDALPTGLSLPDGPVTLSGPNAASWSCTSVSNTVTCSTSVPIAAGGSSTFNLVGLIVGGAAVPSVTNTASVSSPDEVATGNNSGSDTAAVLVSDLKLTKTHSGNFMQTQTGATYILSASNVGTAATSGAVTVTDTLPAGLTATGISGAGWTCTLGTLSCTRSDALAAGASFPAITLTVNVTANAPTSVTNTASVSGGGQTNTANDTASDSTTITVAPPDLTLSKTHTGSFTVGLSASFTFTVNNIAAGTAVGTITVIDVLPAGLTLPNGPVTLTGTSAASWSCSAATNTVTCTSTVNILGGGSSTFTLSGIVVGGAAVPSVTNTASVSNAGETATGNNSASDTATVLQTDLQITKTHGAGFGPGGSGRYTIAVSNAGTAPSSGAVSVTDLLPAPLSAVAIGGPGWSCTLATLSCTRSDSLAAGASYPAITLDVTVSSSPPASATNTVSVSGGNDANTGNNSAQDLTSIPTTFTGYTVSGAVYSDLNANGQRDPGEAGVAGVILTLRDSGGTVLTTASSGAGGLYSFPGLVPGSYAVLRTAVSGAVGTSPDALNVTVTLASVSGVDFGVFAGLKLSGQLFLDDGWGGTAAGANDALRNGTEAALSGMSVTVSNSGGILASAMSDGSGRYTVYLAGSAGSVTVRADPKQGRSYTATGLNDAVTVLHAATSATDPLASQSTLDATSLAGQSVTRNFALVPLLALTPDAAQTVSSPGSVLYRQRLTAGTPGTLSFSLTSGSPFGSPFSYQLWQDLNGNGVVDPATDALLLRSAGDTASVALSSGSARTTGGSLADLQLIVTVAAPAGIAAGLSDPVRLNVTQALANLSGVTRVSSVTDTTTTGAGGLKLTKYVRNVSAGSGFDQVGADARSGDTLEYCIVYQNLGAAALDTVDLTDPVPSFTNTLDGYGGGLGIQYVPGTLVTAGQTITPGTPANALTSAADGDAGTLTPSLLKLNLGTVIGGGRGSVCYRVVVY